MSDQNSWIPHPGVIITEELEARGWAQRDLAYIMDVREEAVYLILSGKRGISPEMAKALGAAFKVDSAFFSNLQNSYDLSRAKEPEPGIAARSRLQSVFPIREMIKRGWMQDTKDASLLEAQLAHFAGANSVENIPHFRHAAKKSAHDDFPPAQLAWLWRARQMAQALTPPRYSEKALKEILPELQNLMLAPEEIRRVPKLLHDAGIRFVVVERLPKSNIDGVCFWLDKHSPVVGLSVRYDRIDNFWFVLRHELQHVLRGDGRDVEVLDAGLEGDKALTGGDLSEAERECNRSAAEFIIPADRLTDFIVRVKPLYSRQRILGLAKVLNIHPGLIVGQLQNKKEIPYTNFRDLLAKVRTIITSTALTDGWGNVAHVYQ